MNDRSPYGALAARVRRPPSPGRGWALFVVLFIAALPRLWRFESVGEGTDEAFSVTATRAMLDDRFSYRNFDDFAVDAYQAKFCPVAEACAVPFVAVFGDRPLSYRLPSLLASLALGALLVRFAARRFGTTAAFVTAGLWALDYRGVVYAQTHRYVALEQLLAFVAFLAVDRADRTRRIGPALVAFAVGLLLFHTHLLAVLTLGALGLGSLASAWWGRGGPRRAPATLATHALLLIHVGFVFALFRAVGLARFFDAGDGLESLKRAVLGTGRMIAGQGLVAAPLGILGAIRLVRGGRTDRSLALCALVPIVAFAIGSLRLPLAPRYVLPAQPFLFVAAGAFAAKAVEALGRGQFARLAGRRTLVVVAVVLLSLTAIPTALYLTGGGGRDMEAPILEALRAKASPGDKVLYDDALFDPFHRRSADLPAVSRAIASDPEGERVVDALDVRYIVRSSAVPNRALYTPSFVTRLELVARHPVRQLFQEPIHLTLYRVRPQ